MYSITIKKVNNKKETIKTIKEKTNAPISEINNNINDNQPVIILDDLVLKNTKILIDLYNELTKLNNNVEIRDEDDNSVISIEILKNQYQMFLDEMSDHNALH